MKTQLIWLSFLSLSLLLPACGKKSDPQPPAPAPNAGSPAGGHEYKPRGTLTVNGVTFEVLSEAFSDKEGAVELKLAAGAKMPAAVRAWVGDETGQGARKARFGAEGDSPLHAHVSMPDVVAIGAQLWFEVEADGKTERAAIAVPR